MKPLGCGEVRDTASEFALGVLDGEERAEVLTHMERCAACRAHISELSDAADALALLTPEAEPPPGFERRTLDVMLVSGRRRRWRTAKLIAVTAAAAAILSVVTVRIIDQSRSPSTPAAKAAATSVAMVGANGAKVGTVEVSDGGSTMSLQLRVEYALKDDTYRVVLDSDKGAKQSLGTMRVEDGWGSLSVIADSASRPATLSLVDPAGTPLCSARLPSA